MTTDKTPPTLAEPRSHRWNDVGERCLDCGDKDWMGGPCSGPRLEAAGSPWVTISTAPNDGRPHIRGLWVTSRIEDKPDTREWRQFIGLINDDGDFVDPDYGESFGWDADQYDAWMPVADAPSATLATAKHGGCVQLSTSERERFEAWAISRGWSIQRCEDGLRRYCSCDTEKMWEAFQAALSAQPSSASSYDLEAMLAACVPGGSIVDPQVIADNIRQWFAAQPSPGGHGDALELADQLRAIVESQHSTSQNAADDTGYLPSDVIDTLNRAAAALAARQPVGEPVGYATFRDGRFGSWLFQTRAMAESHDSTAVAGGPANSEIVPLFRSPAQAVDLGQLWRLSDAWLAKEQDRATDKIYGRALWACAKELRDVLALIDSQAVGNG